MELLKIGNYFIAEFIENQFDSSQIWIYLDLLSFQTAVLVCLLALPGIQSSELMSLISSVAFDLYEVLWIEFRKWLQVKKSFKL